MRVTAGRGAADPVRPLTQTPAKPHSLRLGRTYLPYLYVLPAVVTLGVFIYWPLVQVVRLSFYQWNLVGLKTWLGNENYVRLARDPDLGPLLLQSLWYILLALVGNFLLPVGLAMLTMQVTRRAVTVYQSLLFTPAVISTTVGALLWQWIYLPTGGPLNKFLSVFGIGGINWLNDQNSALLAVSLATSWKFLGFNYLIALAGFSSLPTEPLEAARIDGAVGWSLLKDIIIPLLAPTLMFLGLTTILQALPNTFVPIQILTRGGPSDASTNLLYAVYQDAFQFFQVGKGSAKAVILMLMLGGFAVLQFRLLERNLEYDR